MSDALLLLAHGSRDRRSVAATRALARAVAAVRPDVAVRHAFLGLAEPRAGQVLAGLADAGHGAAVVVPLLLTAAYHSRVDVPAVLADAAVPGLEVRRTPVLGPDRRLLGALARRLANAPGFDAVVLAGAGSSDPEAVAAVRRTAAELGVRFGVPVSAGFASAATPVDEAVRDLHRAGARRVAVASYFLAPGVLHDRVVDVAHRAGAVWVTEPLVDLPELADLVWGRYDAVVTGGDLRAA